MGLRIIEVAFLIFTIGQSLARNVDLSSLKNDAWWKKTIIYQIYPRSFADYNGDGIGDLLGINSKLDYFKDVGIETVWLSPIYKSPMADFGYDISNHTDIDPIFGTLNDFDILLKNIHDKGMKLVMDFVPNHTSNKHEWFLKSLKNDAKYKDYYIWVDPNGYNATGDPIPPNNWLSIFRFSAWEWSEERKQFYFHQFLKEQPDLNYRNPAVVEDMKNVLRFWLDKGVDGFRVDAIQTLFEVDNVTGKDEPKADNDETDPTQHDYLNHIYTRNLPETLVAINGWKNVLSEYKDTFMTLEVYDDDIREVMRFYGNETFPLSDFPFNFYFISNLTDRSTVTGENLQRIVNLWLDNMPQGAWPNWVLGNHDRGRISTRLGVDLIDALNMLSLLLPGTPVTYYGEEIGMEDTFISYKDTQDPSGCNNGPENYMKFSRDPERTPFQWDDSPFAGFTNGSSTWLTVNENYKTKNVKAELAAEESNLKVYQQLAKLRKEKVFHAGNLDFLVATNNALAYIRSLENEPSYIIVINTSEEDNTIDVTRGSVTVPATGVVVVRSSTDTRPDTKVGSSVNLNEISLIGGEGLVLKTNV